MAAVGLLRVPGLTNAIAGVLRTGHPIKSPGLLPGSHGLVWGALCVGYPPSEVGQDVGNHQGHATRAGLSTLVARVTWTSLSLSLGLRVPTDAISRRPESCHLVLWIQAIGLI